MLTLHYNGNTIPTGSGFSLRLTWKNPACFSDEIPAPAGLGIDIPVNQWSRMYFGNPERFERYNSGNDRNFPGFEVRFNGVLLMSGTLKITGASPENYSGWLQSDLGVLGEAQRDKNISELDWDPDGDRTFENKLYYDDFTDDYYPCPVVNGAFWNGKGSEIAVKIKYTDEDGEEHEVNDKITKLTQNFRDNFERIINRTGAGGVDLLGENEDGAGCVVSPYLYLRKFLDMLFKLNGFFIDHNDMVPEIGLCLEQFLLIYNNFNIMEATLTKEWQTLTTYYSEENETREETVEVITGTAWDLGPFKYSELVPHYSLKDILVGLQNYLNYTFVFKPLNKVDILDRNLIPDSLAFDLDDYFLGTWQMGERKDVTLKFVNDFDEEDRMFGQEYHDLTDRRAEFKEAVETKDDLLALSSPVLGELRLVKDENKIYEYRWLVFVSEDILKNEDQKDAMGWEFVSSGPQPYLYGTAEEIEDIKSCFSTLQLSDEKYMHVVLQQGNLRQMKSTFVGFSPRLINSGEFFYPAALTWDGDAGLFKTRWEKWARFWKNRLPVEGSFSLPLNVIYYVTNNIAGKFRTRHGEFIIESMETEFGSDMVGTTKITGFKI